MRKSFNSTLALLSLATVAFGSPQFLGPVNVPRAGSSGPFSLFAYGEGIGGLPVFEMNGSAFIGSRSTISETDSAEAVTFTKGPDDSSQWQATQNTSSSTNSTFFVPAASTDSHQVGFLSSSDSSTDVTTSGFVLFGHLACLKTSGGKVQSLFYAVPSDVDGIWSLNWNSTDESGSVSVALKDTPPSNSRSGAK